MFVKEPFQSGLSHKKNSVDTEGSSEGQSSQQLLPYCLSTHDVEEFTLNRSVNRTAVEIEPKEQRIKCL